jgi:hypothetical protein
MRVYRRPARRALRTAAAMCVLFSVALSAGSQSVASAATVTQNNGCFGNATSTFGQFAVPITGAAAPNPDAAPNPITLSGVSVAISVDAALIGTGVAVGVVSAASDLAHIGFMANDGSLSGTAGISAVTAAVGAVTLKVAATNTVEGTQTATNMAIVTVTFYVTAHADGSNVHVYTSVTNPAPNQAGPDPTRTGTLLVGNLVVPIPLTGHKLLASSAAGTGTNVAGDTIWTPAGGGTVDFSELNSAPSSNTLPLVASQAAAPLQILTKINGLINVNFHCWDGTVHAAVPPATLPTMVPGPSNTITQVTVTGVPASTTTTIAGATTTTTAAPTTTTTAPPVPVNGSATYQTSCTNTVQPKAAPSTLIFTLAATAPDKATAGQPLVVSKQHWQVIVPGSLLTTGINIGLVKPGDTLQGSAVAMLKATNTIQGSVTSPSIPVSIGPIKVDPSTGQASSLATGFAVPDMTFTPTGGTTVFSMGTTVFTIAIPPIKVTFTCTPKTATPLLTTTVTGKIAIPVTTTAGKVATPVTVAGTTTSGAGGTLPRTGASRVWLLLALAFLLIDIGGIALTASRFVRRSAFAKSRDR